MAALDPVEVLTTSDGRVSTEVLTLSSSSAVGHTLLVSYGSDFYTIDDMPNVTSTAGTPQLVEVVDLGSNVGHLKTYVIPVTVGGAQTVTFPNHRDCDIVGLVARIPATVTVDDSAGAMLVSLTTNHVAPEVVTTGPDRMLFVTWIRLHAGGSWSGEQYIVPSGMVKSGEVDTSPFVAMASATETVAAAGATGTRTATWVDAQFFGATTLALAAEAEADDTITADLDAGLPALEAGADGGLTVAAEAAADLPSLEADTDAALTVTGQAAGSLPAFGADADADVTAAGTLDGQLPALTADTTGAATVQGQADAQLPACDSGLDATAASSGLLDAGLPAFTAELDGAATAQAALDSTLPAFDVAFGGTADMGGGGILDAQMAAFDVSVEAEAAVAGGADAALPGLAAAVAATVRLDGALDAMLPVLGTAASSIVATPSGSLAGALPALVAALAGESGATDLPEPATRIGPPRLGWPVSRPSLRWPVRPPTLGR